jgi:putative oxidoreductase
MMAVAYFQYHWKMRFDVNFFPAINKGELAVVYCFVFLFISTQGSGRWSLAWNSKTTRRGISG